MKEALYVTQEGVIFRKDNTIYFQNERIKKHIPIKGISDIYCIGKTTVKSGAAYILMEEKIPVHFFGKYGHYRGTLTPKINLISGTVVVNQAAYYLNIIKRLKIAKEMIRGVKYNILWVLDYYLKKEKDIGENIEKIKKIEEFEDVTDIYALRSYEGKIWEIFYNCFQEIIPNWNFEKRTKRPPENEINSMISFGNSILYSKIISELHKTYLYPAISFVHEPSERRYSLSLDIADIFKPLIVYRTIFRIVNRRKINKKDFNREIGVLLNDKSRRIFIEEIEKTLKTTVKHKTLKRNVSYQYLIRLEGYKLVKQFMEDKKYSSLKAWW